MTDVENQNTTTLRDSNIGIDEKITNMLDKVISLWVYIKNQVKEIFYDDLEIEGI